MSNLVIQLWGIGNLVQTQPLLKTLGEGDILVDPRRSTHEIRHLFPGWKFLTSDSDLVNRLWEDVYVCFPIDGRQFSSLANRLHFPVWSFKKWQKPEWWVLKKMADPTVMSGDGPHLKFPVTPPRHEKRIALSIGYLKNEEGWAFKHWGNQNFIQAIRLIEQAGYIPVLFGDKHDYREDGQEIEHHFSNPPQSCYDLSLWEQVKYLGGCEAYLGNDTGMAHVAGALGLPSAVFTVTDRIKNRTGAPELLQFGREGAIDEVIGWLLAEVRDAQSPRAEAQAGS